MIKEKARKKRQMIIDAALKVFVEHGYEKTKIIDIARTAGIGKGTVYEYFDSKEELFRCLLVEYCEFYRENVKVILRELEGRSSAEKLLAMMRAETALKQQVHLNSLNPMQLLIEFTDFPGLKQAIQDMLRFKFETVGAILSEGIQNGEFRPINVALATAALMGAGSTVNTILDHPEGPDCRTEKAEAMVSEGDLQGFTDENLLDLLIRGLAS